MVSVQLWEGRTVDQKRRLAEAITQAMIEHAGASPDALHVNFVEFSLENWARGGVLGVDRAGATTSPPPPRATRLAHLLLQVRDLPAAEGFYVDALGLRVRERSQFRDGRPLVVTHEGLGLTDRRPEGEGPLEHLAFHVAGLDEVVARARAAGAPILRGPEESSYGRSVYLSDPDGNVIELIGSRAD